MFWKDFNITFKKYYKYFIFIIIILTIEFNAFERNDAVIKEKQDNSKLVISVLEGASEWSRQVEALDIVKEVVTVESIEEGREFVNYADLFLYETDGKRTAVINPYSENAELAVSVIDTIKNTNLFQLSVLTGTEDENALAGEDFGSGIMLFLTILAVAILLLSYNLVKDDEIVKTQIVYSPENNKTYIRSKTIFMILICSLFAVFFSLMYEADTVWGIALVFLLMLYSFIGFNFAVFSENKVITTLFWLIMFGITVSQMFLLKALDRKEIPDILNKNSYWALAGGLILVLMGYLISQRVWHVRNELERKQ